MKRVAEVIDGVTNYNVYDSSGTLVHVEKGSTGLKTQYVRAAGMPIAHIKPGAGIHFMHADHLGSTAVGTSWGSGGKFFEEYYSPFGEALTPNAYNDNHAAFTGHIRDKATGLNYSRRDTKPRSRDGS